MKLKVFKITPFLFLQIKGQSQCPEKESPHNYTLWSNNKCMHTYHTEMITNLFKYPVDLVNECLFVGLTIEWVISNSSDYS